MATPHNQAEKNEIAKVVLMSGDPLRAKYIAETYLEDIYCFNTVRNMFGYTGTYKGKRISIMGSGMGMPSMGIYSYELFALYDVECIIRIGSAGSYSKDLHVFDLVLAQSSWSESTYARVQSGDVSDFQYPSSEINRIIIQQAKALQIPIREIKVHSSDVFYHEENVASVEYFNGEHGCECVEMESFALFHNAKVLGKKAACMLTISDSLITHEVTSAKQRETSFEQMMLVALASAWELSKDEI